MYVELYIASKHQSATSSAGSTMVVPQHYQYHGDRSKLLCFCSRGSTMVENQPQLKSLILPNSFRNGRKIFTATTVVLPRPRKLYSFTSVTMVVPWYYLQMIWQTVAMYPLLPLEFFFGTQNSIYYLQFNSYTNPKQHAFFLALDLFIYKTSKGLH